MSGGTLKDLRSLVESLKDFPEETRVTVLYDSDFGWAGGIELLDISAKDGEPNTMNDMGDIVLSISEFQ